MRIRIGVPYEAPSRKRKTSVTKVAAVKNSIPEHDQKNWKPVLRPIAL
jgi:hypothetical protein